VDLAEIHLFKLGEVNLSYSIVGKFSHFLEERNISFLSFGQKRKILNYYMQEKILFKYKTNRAANQYAGKFIEFQIEYEQYRKLLLRSANKATVMWQ